MLTERQAGTLANSIHRSREAGKINILDSLKLLHKIDLYLSETQLRKLADLEYEWSHNRHMYDDQGEPDQPLSNKPRRLATD
jgi:hypothetical protein